MLTGYYFDLKYFLINRLLLEIRSIPFEIFLTRIINKSLDDDTW